MSWHPQIEVYPLQCVEDERRSFSEGFLLYTSICCYNYNRKYFSVKFLLTFLFWMKWWEYFIWFPIAILISLWIWIIPLWIGKIFSDAKKYIKKELLPALVLTVITSLVTLSLLHIISTKKKQKDKQKKVKQASYLSFCNKIWTFKCTIFL